MTLVNCGWLLTPLPVGASTFGGNSLIDAADEYAWSPWVITRPGGGDITHIHYRTNTVTTGATVTYGLFQLDASSNLTTTLWGTTTNGVHVIAGTDDNLLFRQPLTLPATVVLGDNVGIAIQNPTVSAGTINFARGIAASIGNRGWPPAAGPLSTDQVDGSSSNFALEYDDGYIELSPGSLPGACTPSAVTINTGTSPDEIGNHWTQPYDARCAGWWGFIAATTAAITWRVSLYAASSNTPLATTTFDSDYTTSTVARQYYSAWSDAASGVVLAAGTAYRLTIVALSASSINGHRTTVERNAFFSSFGLPGIQETSRSRSSTTDPDSAAWTETSTQMIQLGMIIDQVDDGAGSGGGGAPYHGAMAGGLLA